MQMTNNYIQYYMYGFVFNTVIAILIQTSNI